MKPSGSGSSARNVKSPSARRKGRKPTPIMLRAELGSKSPKSEARIVINFQKGTISRMS